MLDLTVSVVRYNQREDDLVQLARSVKSAGISTSFFLIDNSEVAIAGDFADKYVKCRKNIGFGAGHNIALREVIGKSKYHLVLNPDITFPPGTLERLFFLMEGDCSVGMVMPKIVYPDGSMQHLCNLIPSAIDLIIRRLKVDRFFQSRGRRYKMQRFNYDKVFAAPFLSGCFLFFRASILKEVGFFDERFFLYMEDLDFSRRVAERYLTLYFPGVYATHGYAKGSYRNAGLFFLHLSSAIKYFTKWGWFFDPRRREINKMYLRLSKEWQ